MSIAKTIYQQINGNRMQLMVGAYNFINHGQALSFRFKGSKIANYCKITLNSKDLYDMEFIKIWGIKVKPVKTINDLYFDQLLDIFEEVTKLYTHF